MTAAKKPKIVQMPRALTPERVRLVAMQLIDDSDEAHTTISKLGQALRKSGYKVMNGYLASSLTKKGSGFVCDEHRIYLRSDLKKRKTKV